MPCRPKGSSGGDGRALNGIFSNPAKALANADSSAWAIIAVGKAEVWHTNSMFTGATRSFDQPLLHGLTPGLTWMGGVVLPRGEGGGVPRTVRDDSRNERQAAPRLAVGRL